MVSLVSTRLWPRGTQYSCADKALAKGYTILIKPPKGTFVKYFNMSWVIPDQTGDTTEHVELDQTIRTMVVVLQLVVACSRRQLLSFCHRTLLIQYPPATEPFNVYTNSIHGEVYELFSPRKTAAEQNRQDPSSLMTNLRQCRPTLDGTESPETGQTHLSRRPPSNAKVPEPRASWKEKPYSVLISWLTGWKYTY